MVHGEDAMDEMLREKIALFRFGLITPFFTQKGMGRGERERIMQHIISTQWEIPGSGRSCVGRSTVAKWLAAYLRSGGRIEALKPKQRHDKGTTRSVGVETQAALVGLKRQLPEASLEVLLKVAREREIIGWDFSASRRSLYRMFIRNGLRKPYHTPTDRRRFEAELPNDLWQADCMYGPRIPVEGRLRRTFLFDIIDDHSRLIPHAQFYLRENIDSFRDCLIKAIQKRGLPRKLYTDNGSAFRSHKLSYACAQLGIALLHSAPYQSEGRGKIERLHRTIRTQFLPLLPETLTLEQLNQRISDWVEKDYHQRKHSTTGQKPLARYLAQLSLLRPAPKDLWEFFRTAVRRKVDKDRSVSLNGRLYEAPAGLIGQSVTLLYHEHDPQRIEVLLNQRSYGFLSPLNPAINSRVRRSAGRHTELLAPDDPASAPSYRGGKLFGKDNTP